MKRVLIKIGYPQISSLNELTFKGNIFSFIKLLIIFCAVCMSLAMVLNFKNINQTIQTIFGV